MHDLDAMPELQTLVDRLAATIDDDRLADRAATPVLDAALADARRLVPIVDHVTIDIDRADARSLRGGVARQLGELAGALYASGRAHEATQLLMTAERFSERHDTRRLFVAARRDPRSFVVLCQAKRLVRRDRSQEAEALVEANLPHVADAELAAAFRAF